MTRTSTFYSTAFVSTMTALIVACGGGGGDTYDGSTGMAEPNQCQRIGLEMPAACNAAGSQTLTCIAAGHTCTVHDGDGAP